MLIYFFFIKMNSISNESLWDIGTQKDPIQYHYDLWVEHYKNSIRNSLWKTEWTSNRTLAIESLEKATMEVGTRKQQLRKIYAYLLLVEMSMKGKKTKNRNDYFYNAVEIARIYLWDNYLNTSYGKSIMNVYTSYINPTFMDIFSEEHIPFLLPLLHNKILSESKRREKLRLNKVADKKKKKIADTDINISNFINSSDSSDKVISKLEEVFWPMRMLIVSEESSQTLVSHRWNTRDISPAHMEHMSVNIFDKPRGYSVTVDRGSNESANQFSSFYLDRIYRILAIYITKKEYEFFADADDNTDTIELLEKNIIISAEANDYNEFIANVIHYYDVSRLSRNRWNIESYARAIDICRWVVLSLERRDDLSIENLYNYIDVILWGNIDVIALRSAQSMLLSCNETMNGGGYPFGLSKCNISLEWKIYSIIRAYEAMFSSWVMNKKLALETMQKWAQGGYFDIVILNIFLQSFKRNHTKTKKVFTTKWAVSTYRKSEYKRHLDSWFHQLKIVRSIEDGYHEFRKAEWVKSTQNAVIKKINEHSLELRKLALIRKLIIVTRHGSTISDTPDGPPGDDHEVLTPEWIESSHIKWILFDGLEFQIVTSPLVRACETARIICQRVRWCTSKIMDADNTPGSSLVCPWVTREISIINPRKDQDTWRYNWMAPKILADNTKDLMKYLMNMVSSSYESMTLFITHRDSARHMIFWLMNMFDQDRIRGEKIPIDNDTMYEFYFSWDHLIEWEESKTRGLLFSTFNWRSTLHEVNSIIEDIFWDTFYTIDDRWIDLIILHDIFINFMHRKNEESPEKISVFIEQLTNNPVTKYFPDILKGAKLI